MAKTIAKLQTAATVKAEKTAKQSAKGKTVKAIKGKVATPDCYDDIRKMLDKPLNEVPTLAIGRNGAKVTPRRFHLLQDDIDKLREEWKTEKQIPNPFNRGMYGYFFLSLRKLGKDKSHPFKAVKDQMRQLASAAETKDDKGKTDWQRFIGKESHAETEENAKDVDGKIQQNAYVLQRLGGMTPYGLKLLQIGQQVLKSKGIVIDILKGKDKEICYRLNCNSNTPTNEFCRRRH